MTPTHRRPSMMQRLQDWAGLTVARAIWAGRRRMSPERQTMAYARLMSLGSVRFQKDRPVIKATPANLRQFSRTVYARRAINRIKNTISAMEWEIAPRKGVTLTGELQRQIDTARACFESPNKDDSFRTLLEQVVEDYLVGGAGAIEQEIGGARIRPLWMWPVDALSIQIYAGWSGEPGEPRYMQTLGYGNVGGQQGIPLRNDQLIFIRKDPSTDSPFGYGCLEVAFNSINRQLGAAAYAGEVASNGQPENLLQFEGLDSTNLDRMRDWWRNEIEGQGQTPLLGGEKLNVHKLRGGSDDALFLKYQEFLLREIATAFEISPHNLGLQAHDNRATAEVEEERDAQAIIVPTATNIAAHLTREAIQGRLGFSQLEFRFPNIESEDEGLLADTHEKYYKNNVLTPDEIRERLKMPPQEGPWGKTLYVDTQMAVAAARASGNDPDEPTRAKNKQLEAATLLAFSRPPEVTVNVEPPVNHITVQPPAVTVEAPQTNVTVEPPAVTVHVPPASVQIEQPLTITAQVEPSKPAVKTIVTRRDPVTGDLTAEVKES